LLGINNLVAELRTLRFGLTSSARKCVTEISYLMTSSSCNSYQKTIHQFYLQLREDVLSGQLYCHEEASFSLGGLALQAETGDYNDALGDEYFLPEHYIPSRVCKMLKLPILIITKFRGPCTCLKGIN